jgi:hypothetical protein
LYQFLKNLFFSKKQTPQQALPPNGDICISAKLENNVSSSLHWQPSGLFQLKTVGASYYQDNIAKIAKNPIGENALAFCTATLIPEDTNRYDSNAIKVVIESEHVGYLSGEFAVTFRSYFKKFELDVQTTTCDAVISAGIKTLERTYEYIIELDISNSPTSPTAIAPSYPKPDRRGAAAILHPQSNGTYLITVWLDHYALYDMHKEKRIHIWTADHWTTINYYMMNGKGIGLGHKLFEIPKTEHYKIFGNVVPDARSIISNARLILLNGRMATIELIP